MTELTTTSTAEIQFTLARLPDQWIEENQKFEEQIKSLRSKISLNKALIRTYENHHKKIK